MNGACAPEMNGNFPCDYGRSVMHKGHALARHDFHKERAFNWQCVSDRETQLKSHNVLACNPAIARHLKHQHVTGLR